MALGNGNDGAGSSISLKLVAQQGDKDVSKKIEQPRLVVKEKNEATGKYELTDTKYSQLSGEVVSMRSSHNGKSGKDEVKGFVACIKDGDETYYIDSTMTNASKDLANHLLASIGKVVSISLYVNKNNFPTASVKLADGSFAPTHMPYNALDRDQLWLDIKAQEATKDSADASSDEVAVEDLPF